jgi:hypothetical protein
MVICARLGFFLITVCRIGDSRSLPCRYKTCANVPVDDYGFVPMTHVKDHRVLKFLSLNESLMVLFLAVFIFVMGFWTVFMHFC